MTFLMHAGKAKHTVTNCADTISVLNCTRLKDNLATAD
jgi:hypothetical protein